MISTAKITVEKEIILTRLRLDMFTLFLLKSTVFSTQAAYCTIKFSVILSLL